MRNNIPSDKRLPFFALILVLFIILIWFFATNSPETDRRPPQQAAKLNVDVLVLEPRNFSIQIESYGTVQPRTQSLLVAQVGGQITSINPSFRDGGFFKKGDVLLEIDPRDHQANVKIAEAQLMDAKQALLEENARADQAKKDWLRLGGDETPSDLVLRKPQMLAAEARLVSASANLDKSRLNLERTRITAPFDGRTLKKNADLGQVVSGNAQLGEIYASDAVEIRLPIRNRDLAFLDLPEQYDGNTDKNNTTHTPNVDLISSLVKDQRWAGKVVRTESAIDEQARQLHVVAQIEDPFSTDKKSNSSGAAIKIGQYITAEISGRVIKDALVIPSSAIYQSSFVYLAKNDELLRQEITIAWQNGKQSLISEGLSAGDLIVTTPLGQVTTGTGVKVNGDADADGTLNKTGGPTGKARGSKNNTASEIKNNRKPNSTDGDRS